MQQEIINQIAPVNAEIYRECVERLNFVAKPVGSLGRLETLLAKIAGITGSADFDFGKKCVLSFFADNGVVAEGVAAHSQDVTTALAKLFAVDKACVCVMARSCGAEVFAVDVGMRDTAYGIIGRKLMAGTNNIALGPAMSRETALRAVQIGAETAEEKADAGYRLIGVGEVGIGNTTTASAIAAVLLNKPAGAVTGRGAGITDEGLVRKISAVERAIDINRPDPSDPIDVLAKVGGLDIAAMTGAFLGGASRKTPMVVDGVISAAAALCAVRINPLARDYLIPSHISAEPAGRLLMDELGLEPIINAEMRLGEGTGAAALFPLLDMILAVYNNAATYADLETL